MTNLAATPDGGVLAWEAPGPADGKPILLVPGQAVTMRSWDALLPLFAEHHRVIMFDHRGIGESIEGNEPPRTTREFAHDLLVVLDAAGIDCAHIVGHSMGGRIAQWFAVDAPERVATLTLISTTGGDARFPRGADATADLASGDPSRLGPRFFRPEFLAEHPESIDIFVRPEGSIRTRRRHFEASRSHDSWAEITRISAPTLVVHGALDSITLPDAGRALAAEIPDARLLTPATGRHAPHLDHPEVPAAILDHIENHPAD